MKSLLNNLFELSNKKVQNSTTKVYKKFGIVHAKRFLNHTEIDTTMKYLNIEDDMELIDYGL